MEVEKVASDSVASLDLWKDTLILGSKCLQFINVKKFEWRLSYEESKDITQNVNYKQEQCQVHECMGCWFSVHYALTVTAYKSYK